VVGEPLGVESGGAERLAGDASGAGAVGTPGSLLLGPLTVLAFTPALLGTTAS
jgi:hypothetical protein